MAPQKLRRRWEKGKGLFCVVGTDMKRGHQVPAIFLSRCSLCKGGSSSPLRSRQISTGKERRKDLFAGLLYFL